MIEDDAPRDVHPPLRIPTVRVAESRLLSLELAELLGVQVPSLRHTNATVDEQWRELSQAVLAKVKSMHAEIEQHRTRAVVPAQFETRRITTRKR